jgi:hypothetical protein
MFEKKNQVTVLIEDCRHCPNATLKFDQEAAEDIMCCQTQRSLIMLRENGWGPRAIPNWCPRLNYPTSLFRGLRSQIPGIIDDAMSKE